MQLAAFALPPAAHAAPLLEKFIINQAKAVVPVIPTVVPGGAADVATAGVTTPVTLDSALDPAINPQKLAAAPLAATTPAYDWTQDPILYPIISFGFGVLVIVVPVLIAAVIAIPQWLFEVVREVVESVFGLPAQPAVAGVSVATAEAKATTAPTLTSDPTLSHSAPVIPAKGGPADAAPTIETGKADVPSPVASKKPANGNEKTSRDTATWTADLTATANPEISTEPRKVDAPKPSAGASPSESAKPYARSATPRSVVRGSLGVGEKSRDLPHARKGGEPTMHTAPTGDKAATTRGDSSGGDSPGGDADDS